MTSRERAAGPDPGKPGPDMPGPERETQAPPAQAGAGPAWPGVLLTPEALATYEDLVPGGAERILKLAEQTARTELGIWSEDDSGLIVLSMVIAVVFFGLAVGGIGTRAALIAGAFFVEVPLVILLCVVIRWSALRGAREARQRGDR